MKYEDLPDEDCEALKDQWREVDSRRYDRRDKESKISILTFQAILAAVFGAIISLVQHHFATTVMLANLAIVAAHLIGMVFCGRIVRFPKRDIWSNKIYAQIAAAFIVNTAAVLVSLWVQKRISEA